MQFPDNDETAVVAENRSTGADGTARLPGLGKQAALLASIFEQNLSLEVYAPYDIVLRTCPITYSQHCEVPDASTEGGPSNETVLLGLKSKHGAALFSGSAALTLVNAGGAADSIDGLPRNLKIAACTTKTWWGKPACENYRRAPAAAPSPPVAEQGETAPAAASPGGSNSFACKSACGEQASACSSQCDYVHNACFGRLNPSAPIGPGNDAADCVARDRLCSQQCDANESSCRAACR
jgi:hypothetical protein